MGKNRTINLRWNAPPINWRRGMVMISLWGGLLFGPALQAATLTAQLDRNAVPMGESVTLSLIFEGGAPAGSPSLPGFPGVQIQPGVSSSRNITIVNGRQTSRQIFEYTLVPTQLGNVTIPALQIQVGNEVLTSRPLMLQVVKGNPQNAITNQALLRLVVSKQEVFVGEAFLVEMQLYWKNADNINRPKLEAEGFSFSEPQEVRPTRTQINGEIFNVAVFKLAAIPVKSGTANFGPATSDLRILIPTGRRDSFGGGFGSLFGGANYRPVPTTLSSETIPLKVSPLPSQNVPPAFNGAVGDYRLTVTASPTNLAVGDPITLRAQVAGNGSIESLNLPTQSGWQDFEVYPPSSEVETRDALGLSGSKTFTQVLIPQNHEINMIPPLRFSFFDPQARQYRTLQGPAFPITVQASVSAAVPPPMLGTNTAAQPPRPADDVLPINTRLDGIGLPGPLLAQQTWFWGLQGLPILGWLSLWFWRQRKEMLANNPRLRRHREVAARVQQGLKELRAQASARESDPFFATLFRLLQEQLGERLDLPASAITEAVIDERLQGTDVSADTLSELHALFQTCNAARYAPVESAQELEALIPRLEAALESLRHWTP